MVEEIVKNIFRIEVPLPKNPLKSINSYIITDKNESLIVDTGLMSDVCISAFKKGIDEIGINLEKSRFFVTHMHADHCGMLGILTKDNSTIYMSEEDKPFITGKGMEWDEFWEQSRLFAIQHGFPEKLSKDAIFNHPGYLYSPKNIKGKIEIVSEGYEINIGNYRFKCIKTPGHTLGHVCLYEKNYGILLSGDHILYDITPNISAGYENKNPLGQYLENLNKTKDLNVGIVLPGHRNSFKNLQKRTDELILHHKNRLNEVLKILSGGVKNAYETAALMTWDINYANFNDFPVSQKWFAHTEAIAHLLYLKQTGKVKSKKQNGIYIFSSF